MFQTFLQHCGAIKRPQATQNEDTSKRAKSQWLRGHALVKGNWVVAKFTLSEDGRAFFETPPEELPTKLRTYLEGSMEERVLVNNKYILQCDEQEDEQESSDSDSDSEKDGDMDDTHVAQHHQDNGNISDDSLMTNAEKRKDEDSEAEAEIDREEYTNAIRTLKRYSEVVKTEKKKTGATMGHAVTQRKEKDFLSLNASSYAPYLKQLQTNLQTGGVNKRLKQFKCKPEQFEFPDPKPWGLTPPKMQFGVKELLDNSKLFKKKLPQSYYDPKIMYTLEEQLWAATGASSHSDHFSFGAQKATEKAIKTLRELSSSNPAVSAATDAILKNLTDAENMRKTAAQNNIQIAKTLLSGAATLQLARRDSLLFYRKDFMPDEDVVTLRSQAFGQKDLFGTSLNIVIKNFRHQRKAMAAETTIGKAAKEAKQPQPVAAPVPAPSTPAPYQAPRRGGYRNNTRRYQYSQPFRPRGGRQPRGGGRPFRGRGGPKQEQ